VAVLLDHDWLAVEREQTQGAPRTTYRVHSAVKNRDPHATRSAKSDKSPLADPFGTFVTAPSGESEICAAGKSAERSSLNATPPPDVEGPIQEREEAR
jgi:hypothetical protein